MIFWYCDIEGYKKAKKNTNVIAKIKVAEEPK